MRMVHSCMKKQEVEAVTIISLPHTETQSLCIVELHKFILLQESFQTILHQIH